VLVATKPVDFRKGMNGLAALVQEQLKADPFSGTIYCFRSKRADRVKLVFWDGTGLCLLCKRLEDGKFHWPRVQDGVMRLSAAQLSALLEGLASISALGCGVLRALRGDFLSRLSGMNRVAPISAGCGFLAVMVVLLVVGSWDCTANRRFPARAAPLRRSPARSWKA
jgi:transposase